MRLLLLLACAAWAASNDVEPLSNGLSVSMTGPQIKKKFGEPAHRSWDARSLDYPGFTVQVGGSSQEIWHLTLKKGVLLSCGVGVGSSRAEVEKVFGAADEAAQGRYKLFFSYAGDKVSKIRIDPADESSAPSRKPSQAQAPAPPGSYAGAWHGAGSTIGKLELKADGTYTSPNGGEGTWQPTEDGVLFTGPLAAWNGGRAKRRMASRELLEFHWTKPDGTKYYFVFARD